MDFLFPRSGIFLTAIPKTGCSSAITFFTALEVFLEENKCSNFNLDSELQIFLDYNIKGIHEGGSKAVKYRAENSFQLETENIISIATYRNPYERFASFWFDKIVLSNGVYYFTEQHKFNVAQKKLFSFETFSMDIVRSAAKEFILENSQNLSIADHHIKPQKYFFKKDLIYDINVETKSLSHLPQALSEKSSRFNILQKVLFPAININPKSYFDGFYDEELSDLVTKMYFIDFEFFKNESLFKSFDPPKLLDEVNIQTITELHDLRIDNVVKQLAVERDSLAVERDELTQQRDELTQQRDQLTQQRDQLTQQRDQLTQQRDQLTQQRDQLTQQRDELTQQRDELTKQIDNLISERDAAAGALSAVVNSRIWRFTKLYRKLRSHKP